MNTLRSGFTIIESILVLALTGLVLSVVLVGIGTSLKAERYRDATNQTIDYFQGRYDAVANIANDRPAADACSTLGISNTGGDGRGTSDCLLMGYVVRSTDGYSVNSKQVVALRDVSQIAGEDKKTEVQTLVDSSLVESSVSNPYEFEWGARLLFSSNPAEFSMLVLRAPLSGAIRTFMDTTSGTATLSSLLTSPLPAGGVSFCIDPSGIFNAGIQKNGILIDQNASNSSGVRQLSAGTC